MKKKLIAALTSAAMVATMVPATAFAADTAVMTAKETGSNGQRSGRGQCSNLG